MAVLAAAEEVADSNRAPPSPCSKCNQPKAFRLTFESRDLNRLWLPDASARRMGQRQDVFPAGEQRAQRAPGLPEAGLFTRMCFADPCISMMSLKRGRHAYNAGARVSQ